MPEREVPQHADELPRMRSIDLVAGVKRVMVVMTHTSRNGDPKLLSSCTLPLTGLGCVDAIVTDIAGFERTEDGLVLTELAPGVTVDEVREKTDASFRVAETVREMRF